MSVSSYSKLKKLYSSFKILLIMGRYIELTLGYEASFSIKSYIELQKLYVSYKTLLSLWRCVELIFEPILSLKCCKEHETRYLQSYMIRCYLYSLSLHNYIFRRNITMYLIDLRWSIQTTCNPSFFVIRIDILFTFKRASFHTTKPVLQLHQNIIGRLVSK